MQIRFRDGQLPRASGIASSPAPTAGRFLEMDPPSFEVPAQVIIYDDGAPEVIDAQAREAEDGSTIIFLPIDVAPPAGTPIQIILYGNPEEPTVIEGSTSGDGLDGTLDIDIPDGLLL